MKMSTYLRNPVVIIVLLLAVVAIVLYADVPGGIQRIVDDIRATDEPSPTESPSDLQRTLVVMQATHTALAQPTSTRAATATPIPSRTPPPEPTFTRTTTSVPTAEPTATPPPPPSRTPTMPPPPPPLTLIPSPFPSCGPATQFSPASNASGNRVIDTTGGWVHADLSSNILGYDEVSILLEPGTQITVARVGATAWRYDPGCNKAFIDQQISDHQDRRRQAGKTIISVTLNQLQQAGIILSEPPLSSEQAVALFGGSSNRWQPLGGFSLGDAWKLTPGSAMVTLTLPSNKYCVHYWDNFREHRSIGPLEVQASEATIYFSEFGYYGDC